MKMDRENSFLILEDKDLQRIKKITATNMTALLGTNKFRKRGDAMLMILNLYKEQIDPFYTARGEWAERILREKYKQEGYTVKYWDKFEIKFDNFPQNKEFGGMIDMCFTAPTRELVECKSKNISKLEETKKFKNDDYEHQAQFYGYWSKCKDINLTYVFFTDEQEQKIRNNEPLSLNPSEYTFYSYKVPLDEEKFKAELKMCLVYKNQCLNERKIPLEDISQKILDKLNISGVL